MSLKDDRTVSVDKGKTSSGRRTVSYRMPSGRTKNATVLGQGTGSGLKLLIPGGTDAVSGRTGARVVDNVAAATTMKQTGVYFSRNSNI